MRTGLLVALLGTTLIVAAPARAVDVTFQVHMQQQVALGRFDPGSDSVDIAGEFNDWGATPTLMADQDGDSIYTATVGGFSEGQIFEYKFRLNESWGGTEEFPGYDANRMYTVTAGENRIDAWYDGFVPGSAEPDTAQLSWWNDRVFYEIFVRSFYDSDGDGIGDLAGLTMQLDYLNDGDPATDTDLGITGIWLMPINDSPSYHGYDSTDYRAINPDYGTMADFETFLAEAHARGIKVIVDYVMNHCSDQHPWFVASCANDPVYRDWFRWSDTDPGESDWHLCNGDWYYGHFGSGMPDLNYDSPALKTEMFDTATWWLQTVGVDGFRLDAVLYIDEDPGQTQTTPETLQFWEDYNTHVKSVKPDMLSVGEAWTGTTEVLQYTNQARLDLCFEFDLSYATVGAINSGNASWLDTRAALTYVSYDYLQYATFLSNHDQDRSFSTFGEDQSHAKAAAALYLTLPGVPFVYYGEELGMIGTGDHLNIRRPMQWDTSPWSGFSLVEPWQDLGFNWSWRNVASEEIEPSSLLNFYKQMIRLRNGNAALRRGNYVRLASSQPEVMAFVRQYQGQTVLCLINTSGQDQNGFEVAGLLGSLEPGNYETQDLIHGWPWSLEVTDDYRIRWLGLTPYEVEIYEMTTASGIGDGNGPPRQGLRLEQNHPNPFNPSTTIRYSLPAASQVHISVYDVAGREVAVLHDGPQSAGPQSARWDGTDRKGQPAGAGVYFARVESDFGVAMRKMALVK